MKAHLFALFLAIAVGNFVSRETAAQGPAEPTEGRPETGLQRQGPVRFIAWPTRPRGGVGSFQALWTSRIARDPNDGLASFFTDRIGADGERLRPEVPNPPEHLCARPDPAELGSRLRVTGPGGSIVCRVADIGPRRDLKRELDLLPAGFKAIGLRRIDGLGRVRIERVGDQ